LVVAAGRRRGSLVLRAKDVKGDEGAKGMAAQDHRSGKARVLLLPLGLGIQGHDGTCRGVATAGVLCYAVGILILYDASWISS
jgi:hypothetical protein